jgi:glucose/arabinose dehydrogenase
MKVSQDLITGASQEMMPAINEAQQQVSQAQAIGQAQQPKAPQGPDPQQLQAVLAAVNSLEQMVEQLMQPRAVLRDENGLLTQY